MRPGSSARTIMRSVQLSDEFLNHVVIYARQHVLHWRNTHSTLDGVERAFDASRLKGEHVELWLAAQARVAAINPAIPAESLWDAGHHLYDAELAAALPAGVN